MLRLVFGRPRPPVPSLAAWVFLRSWQPRWTPAQRARFEAAKKQGSGTPRTVSHKDCLTSEKLAEDPFTDKPHGDNVKCDETILKSTSTDFEVRELCSYGSSKTDVHLSFHADSPEHVTGSGTTHSTVGGHELNSTMKMESKW